MGFEVWHLSFFSRASMSDKKDTVSTGLSIGQCCITFVGGAGSDSVGLPRILSVSSLPPGILLWQCTPTSSPCYLVFMQIILSLVNDHPHFGLNILIPITGQELLLKIL
jgi:hypothetical protein